MYSFTTLQYFMVLLMCLWSSSNGKTCESFENRMDCPGEDDPYDFTECCNYENTTKYYCCENPLHLRSNRLLVRISISVIFTCFFLSALIIVCCFWSKCPLSDLCWANYSQRGVIAYTKEGEALNEPPDENEYSRRYTPVNVKVSRVDEV